LTKGGHCSKQAKPGGCPQQTGRRAGGKRERRVRQKRPRSKKKKEGPLTGSIRDWGSVQPEELPVKKKKIKKKKRKKKTLSND